MRKFEEAVVEETTETTETPVEETPDSGSQLVELLVGMGLSAEQAEAVHQMAMDLVNSGSGEEQKVEASRLRRRRNMSRSGRKTLFADDRRNQETDEVRMLKRRLRRKNRQLRELRSQVENRPGGERVQFGHSAPPSQPAVNPGVPGSVKNRVFDMIKDSL